MEHRRRSARRVAARLVAAGLATGLATGLLAGCSEDGQATEQDQKFLDALVQAGVIAEDATEQVREDAVKRGRKWCETLTDPDTTREDVARALATMLRESEAEASQKGITLYGTAASTYCPEASDRLK